MNALRWLAYEIGKWWVKRAIRVCTYRREELDRIVARERRMIEWDERRLNARFREMEARQLESRLERARV